MGVRAYQFCQLALLGLVLVFRRVQRITTPDKRYRAVIQRREGGSFFWSASTRFASWVGARAGGRVSGGQKGYTIYRQSQRAVICPGGGSFFVGRKSNGPSQAPTGFAV